MRRRSAAVNFTAAIRYAREWGVPVILQPDVLTKYDLPAERHWEPGVARPIEVSHSGPIGGGIHWPTQTIIWPVDDIDRWDIPPFIHELSHVLVDVDPDDVSETDSAILAMDHAAFRFLGASDLWHDWMRNFETQRGRWPMAPIDYRNDLLVDSQLQAERDGLLDENWKPTFQRIKRKVASRAA